MSFTMILFSFVFCLLILCMIVGAFFRKRYPQKKPSFLRIIVLMGQMGLLVLFFTDSLIVLNKTLLDILWCGIVLVGFLVGIHGMKHHAVISVAQLVLSIVSAILMALIVFITSM